jgi:hypothetical protein
VPALAGGRATGSRMVFERMFTAFVSRRVARSWRGVSEASSGLRRPLSRCHLRCLHRRTSVVAGIWLPDHSRLPAVRLYCFVRPDRMFLLFSCSNVRHVALRAIDQNDFQNTASLGSCFINSGAAYAIRECVVDSEVLRCSHCTAAGRSAPSPPRSLRSKETASPPGASGETRPTASNRTGRQGPPPPCSLGTLFRAAYSPVPLPGVPLPRCQRTAGRCLRAWLFGRGVRYKCCRAAQRWCADEPGWCV